MNNLPLPDAYSEEGREDFEIDLATLIQEVNERLLWPFQVEGTDTNGGHFLIFSLDVPMYDIRCPLPSHQRRKIIWGDLSLYEKRMYIARAGYICLNQNNPPLIPSFEDYYNDKEQPS